MPQPLWVLWLASPWSSGDSHILNDHAGNKPSVQEQSTTIHSCQRKTWLCVCQCQVHVCRFMHACPYYQTCACGGPICTCTYFHNIWGGGFPIKLMKLDHTMSSSSCARITLLRDKQLLRRYELSQIKFIHTALLGVSLGAICLVPAHHRVIVIITHSHLSCKNNTCVITRQAGHSKKCCGRIMHSPCDVDCPLSICSKAD